MRAIAYDKFTLMLNDINELADFLEGRTTFRISFQNIDSYHPGRRIFSLIITVLTDKYYMLKRYSKGNHEMEIDIHGFSNGILLQCRIQSRTIEKDDRSENKFHRTITL